MRLPYLRLLRAVILLFLCALAMRMTWRTGGGRLLAHNASHALLREQADKGVAMSPMDPETHSARALVLYNLNEIDGTLRELERATVLRPRDYLLWLRLGRARDEAGDKEGALLAIRESIKLAPYYSEPRWQYGNVLYRMGRFDEAFRELRQSSESNPALLPVLIDLAWGTYGGDARSVEAIVSPRTDAQRLVLSRFFVKKGKISEALALFRATGEISPENRKAILVGLMKAKQFKGAYEVWATGRDTENERRMSLEPIIVNPSFEGRINLSEVGFGWQQEQQLEGVKLSLETNEPRSGSRCLLIEWKGQSNPSSSIISQVVLVEPRTRYRLNFFTRTEGLIAAGLPVLTVTDARAEDVPMLAQSKAFPKDAKGWQEYEVEFTTYETTEAVLISVRRESCEADPCPMFGRVWLDDFSLRKL